MKITYLLTLISLLALLSCRKEPTSWDTDWKHIIAQDTLSLQSLVVDSILGEEADSPYRLLINRNLFAININDLVIIRDTVIQDQVGIPIGISVPPGTQFINQIDENVFNFQGLQLKRVNLSGGKITLRVSSPIATKCLVTVTLPKLSQNGQDLAISFEVPPGSAQSPQVYTQEVNLDGYQLDLSGTNGDSFNIIQSQISVQSDPNGGAVNVAATDQIEFDLGFKDIRVNYARGYFGTKIYPYISTVNFDFMDRVVNGAIDFEQVKIKLTFINGIKMSARALVNSFVGAGNGILQLDHPIIQEWLMINQATGDWNNLQSFQYEIDFNDQNSNIEQFLELIPRAVQVDMRVETNPFGNTSGGYDELYGTSELRAYITADMPLAIGMNNLRLRDTLDLKWAESANFSAKSGKISMQISNAFSFGASISIQALNSENEIILEKPASATIQGSNMVSNFNPAQILESLVEFSFDEAEVVLLKKMERIVVNAVFNSPNNGEIASVYPEQFLAFRIFSTFKLNSKF